ncbi:MAG: S8 family serine peptidase [Myxococcota bacterium]
MTRWNQELIGVPHPTLTGRGVCLALLDSGIYAEHECFSGVEVLGRDFTGAEDASVFADGFGHGTHCASIALEMSPGIERLLVARVLTEDGTGYTDQLASALRWAWEQGAHVVSSSLNVDVVALAAQYSAYYGDRSVGIELAAGDYGRVLLEVSELLREMRSSSSRPLLFCAAGNVLRRPGSALAPAQLPAFLDGVVSVGALARPTSSALQTLDSSRAPVDVVAPGEAIVGAGIGHPRRTARRSGTSPATAHAAGVAALFLEAQNFDPDAAWEALGARAQRTLERFDSGAELVGAGLVQAP